MIAMLLLCACGKKSEVWETDGAGLVQMETPEDGEKIVEKGREVAANGEKVTERQRSICGSIRKRFGRPRGGSDYGK